MFVAENGNTAEVEVRAGVEKRARSTSTAEVEAEVRRGKNTTKTTERKNITKKILEYNYTCKKCNSDVRVSLRMYYLIHLALEAIMLS